MINLLRFVLAALCSLHGIAANSAISETTDQRDKQGQVVVRSALALPFAVRGGRVAFARDPVAGRLASGQWQRPEPGVAVELPDGEIRRWESIEADEAGWFRGRMLLASYVSAVVDVPEAGVYVLEAQGHSAVFVNGVPRGGNPYGYGYYQLPVELKKGQNELLFRVGRGRLRVALREPRATVELIPDDATLPDPVEGDDDPLWLAVPVTNCTSEPVRELVLTVRDSDGEVLGSAELPELLPCSLYKAAVQIVPGEWQAGETVELTASVGQRGGSLLDRGILRLTVVERRATRRVTFRSRIDGSVQYYAVAPPTGAGPHGLVLTLHGAAVEAIGQARAYRAKEDLWIVAPTNRRPFGFDWEDWGRLDTIEVLDLVLDRYPVDPRRVYLTGHSMGGHGTWHLGVTFPGRFAAIGPSAGWISFAHYGGRRRSQEALTPKEDAVLRGASPGRTLDLVQNLRGVGVYVLHGSNDDNVPVSQARVMRQVLGQFHSDFAYHEEPGKGHWWGLDLSRFGEYGGPWGTACVDWPPMFYFFRWHVLPEVERDFTFRTFNPGISSRRGFLTIEQQERPLELSVANVSSTEGALDVSTDNVRGLSLALDQSFPDREGAITVQIDGDQVRLDRPARIRLVRSDGQWRIAEGELPAEQKGPHRYGPFREAFQNEMVFVYGTAASNPEVNRWCQQKARLDAEVFWYRGNGAVQVVSDRVFLAGLEKDPVRWAERNVILYGGKNSNRAYSVLVGDSPVEVGDGVVRVGDQRWTGDRFGCLFVRPRKGTGRALVAVQAGSGIVGCRVLDHVPIFVSGVGLPDYVVVTPKVFESAPEGIIAAGYFDHQWELPQQVDN